MGHLPAPGSLEELAHWVQDQAVRGACPLALLDNFDATAGREAEFSETFFRTLRELNRSGLVYVTSQERFLSHLLNGDHPVGRFFASFEPVPLGLLQAEEAAELLDRWGEGKPPLPSEATVALVEFAGGYPARLALGEQRLRQAEGSGTDWRAVLQRARDEAGPAPKSLFPRPTPGS